MNGLTWFGWVEVILLALGVVLAPLTIGRRWIVRTQADAAARILVNAIVIGLILTVGVNT